MAKLTNEFRRWAALGAQARLAELEAEIDGIRRAFPDLRGHRSAAPQSAGVALKRRGRPPQTKVAVESEIKPKRTMSVEARKRIGDAQRKRWAAQREQQKSEEAPAPAAEKKVRRRGARGARRRAA
jgi:hypothetical protein